MATLYELTQQAGALYELLQREEIDEQVFNDTLEAMEAGEKVESYCKLIKQLQSDVDVFEAEAARLAARKKTAANSVTRMKAALLSFLQASGLEKTKAGTFAVRISTSQAVNITDETAVPPEFIELSPRVKKAALKEALKEGATIPGAELITNQGVVIR